MVTKAGLAGAGLILTAALTSGEAPLRVGDSKQLFIDQRFITHESGVKIVVNRPRITGERLLAAEKPWEAWSMGGYTSVVQEGGRVHLWYTTSDHRGHVGVAYALSTNDGATFIRPDLGIVDYEGSKHNNLVILGPYEMHVFENRPDSPKSERFCMFTGGPARANRLFNSPDGLHWRQEGKVPFVDVQKYKYLTLDSQNVIFWDTRLRKYVLYARANLRPAAGTAGVNRTFWYASNDALGGFENFQIAFQRDARDGVEFDWYTVAALRYQGAADAYFMWPAAYHHSKPPPGNDGLLDIQFALSRDGVRWERPDRKPVIRLGLKGEWNDSSLYAGYGLTRHGDELSLYYTGENVSHYGDDQGSYCGVISRAIYRLDGFVSVDASYDGGEFTTPPIIFSGDQLHLNFDGSAGGWTKVEMLDSGGRPVPGFTARDADLEQGNGVNKLVTWNGKADVSRLRGTPVRLHFIMRDSRLYAFQFPAAHSSSEASRP